MPRRQPTQNPSVRQGACPKWRLARTTSSEGGGPSGGGGSQHQSPQGVCEDAALILCDLFEPQAATGTEVPLAAPLPLGSDDSAPHDLGGEGEKAKSGREFQGARKAWAEEAQVFDARAFNAEVQEADFNVEGSGGRMFRKGHTRGRTSFSIMGHCILHCEAEWGQRPTTHGTYAARSLGQTLPKGILGVNSKGWPKQALGVICCHPESLPGSFALPFPLAFSFPRPPVRGPAEHEIPVLERVKLL